MSTSKTHGEPLFRAIIDGDHERIVAKRIDAPYRAGPHNAWLKMKKKNYSRREAVEWKRTPSPSLIGSIIQTGDHTFKD